MGKLNLIKADFTGKVGQLVGAKWKNLSTVRSYSKPAYTNTPAQQDVRTNFAQITTIVAAFAPQIKSLSSLSVRSMSVRNAIIKLNKGIFSGGGFDPATMKINSGGLPAPTGVTVTPAATHDNITATWAPVTGATISAKAKVVFVIVDDVGSFAVVGEALNSAGTMAIAAEYTPSARLNVYYYLIDYRGSAKVGSTSGYQSITIPTRSKNVS